MILITYSVAVCTYSAECLVHTGVTVLGRGFEVSGERSGGGSGASSGAANANPFSNLAG